MAFRNDTENFPFDDRTKFIWYYLIDWEKRIQTDYCTVANKKELVKKLEEIIIGNKIEKFKLCGVWPGNYSTDIFNLSIKDASEKLADYFSE
jgi:hypothetical protein